MSSSFVGRFRRFWQEDGIFLALVLALFAGLRTRGALRSISRQCLALRAAFFARIGNCVEQAIFRTGYKPMLFWNLLILQRVTFLLSVLVGLWKVFRRRATPATLAGGNPRQMH